MNIACPTLRHPRPDAADGLSLHSLIAACPPLDVNTVYAYQLLVHHHYRTCMLAVDETDQVLGAVTGYLLPARPRTLFIWQLAVAEAGRGQGLASRLLDAQVAACSDIDRIQTTIGPDNAASRRSFDKLAARLGGRIASAPFLPADSCGPGHDPEDLISIDGFTASHTASEHAQETHR